MPPQKRIQNKRTYFNLADTATFDMKTFTYKEQGYEATKYVILLTETHDVLVWFDHCKRPILRKGERFNVYDVAGRTSKNFGYQFHTTETSRIENLGAVKDVSTTGSPPTIQSGLRKSSELAKSVSNNFFNCPHCRKKIFYRRD